MKKSFALETRTISGLWETLAHVDHAQRFILIKVLKLAAGSPAVNQAVTVRGI